jgi:hypothetical protein
MVLPSSHLVGVLLSAPSNHQQGVSKRMATITLELPDELVGNIHTEALSALWREFVSAKFAKVAKATNGSAAPTPIYHEPLDFLASQPTREQVIAYRISSTAQERLSELLYRNREETLTAAERAELDTYLHLSDWLALLKARARNS